MAATLVAVAWFDNLFEAGYWQGLLEAQGVPVVLADKEIVAVEWQISRAVGNIKLQVPDAEAGLASGILDALRKEHPYRPAEESDARRALRIAFLGLMFPPLQLYSLSLLARLLRHGRDLSARDRLQMALAALFDLCLPVFVAAWIVYWRPPDPLVIP